ncbi:MAG: DNA recombination protein RmuC [Helicobacteraceae bacterium]|jgi:DNA recombination protein RmuC|nr:DNA recombination protein RmuC [Helicobacteraceae bacterium]
MNLPIEYLLVAIGAIGALNLIAAIALIVRKNVAIDPMILAQLNRLETAQAQEARLARAEQAANSDRFAQNVSKTIDALVAFQKERFDSFAISQEALRKISEENLKDIRAAIEKQLTSLREENAKKLDEMRKIVDEKLAESIGKRFSESFNLISERLEKVHLGLGEMQKLAQDVGGLKNALINVKTRGAYGEAQLSAILDQVLSKEQYFEQYPIKGGERVDFAVKLPGRGESDEGVLLPIDSKFPIEDYQRLTDAFEQNADKETIDGLRKAFEISVKEAAKSISQKYVCPPRTTDFAVMFVPTEGLYAEILRVAGLHEFLQQTRRIVVVGPTNLVAFLNSLQMGFKTLAIEKRSSEVWALLGAIKSEFGKFGEVLDKAKRQIQSVANTLDETGTRTKAIERRLRGVEALPSGENRDLLGGDSNGEANID